MTQTCPNEDDLFLFTAGDQTENLAVELNKHIADCNRCQSLMDRCKELRVGISADVPGLHPQNATNEVMRKIRSGNPQPATRAWLRGWYLGMGSAAAAAAVALFVVLGGGENNSGTFQARSSETKPELERKVGADFYAMRDGALMKLDERMPVRAAEGLSLSYINAVRDRSVFMLAFVVDSQHEIHWLYPAYTDATKDPLAIELRATAQQVVLPDTVQLDNPAAGNASLIWIAATERRSVSSVEALAMKARTAASLRKLWPNSEVGHVRVRIER